jgi:protein-S-isoprenylcysteine O-methyltransferase Ste14
MQDTAKFTDSRSAPVDGAPNRIPWPPIVFLAAIVAAWALDWLLPLRLPHPASPLWQVAGLTLILAGLMLDFWTAHTLYRHRTTILPHRAVTQLVTSGPFALSRNPIYIGNTAVVLGLGLAFAIVWPLLAAPVAAFVVQKLAIEREEDHLARRFGRAWYLYAARTPRWLLF